nr:nuclear speckle RNA-binding protein A-like isoform X2 [Lolium perenne]XP_051197912.1 nuclear speckle RNA-binding protein A-like isoform X3 [Lolium perenne]
MADAYWRQGYGDPRQQQQQQQQQQLMLPPSARALNPAAAAAAAGQQQQPLKRPRPADYPADLPGAHEMAGYYPREEDRAGYAAVRETQALNASYERFLRTGQIQSYGAGPAGGSIRPTAGANAGYQADDRPVVAAGGMDGRNAGFGGGISEPPLPPDASNTLFIEGIPTDCERREVSHIFRPFVGFKEVRLVTKDPRHPGGDPIVLCFVDFANAAQAAVSMEALQGYKFDEHDRNSPHLRLQFARFTGPRGQSGPGGGGGRVRR